MDFVRTYFVDAFFCCCCSDSFRLSRERRFANERFANMLFVVRLQFTVVVVAIISLPMSLLMCVSFLFFLIHYFSFKLYTVYCAQLYRIVHLHIVWYVAQIAIAIKVNKKDTNSIYIYVIICNARISSVQ